MQLISSFLLLTGAAAAPPIGPYPTPDVLSAFAEVCRPIESLEEAAATATKIGWKKFEPDPSSPIGNLIELGKSEGPKMLAKSGGEMLPTIAFRRRVVSEDLVVILSGVKIGDVISNGCRLYDVGESRNVPAAAVAAWLKRSPTRIDKNAIIHVASWEPGYDARHDSFELYFVPAGSPAVELVGFSGVALKADFVGAAKE